MAIDIQQSMQDSTNLPALSARCPAMPWRQFSAEGPGLPARAARQEEEEEEARRRRIDIGSNVSSQRPHS
eukprot:6637663-Pyramimonas_sp.AAC.1